MGDGTQKQRGTVRLPVDQLYTNVSIHTPYPLEESEFLRITKVISLVPIWAHALATGTAVFVITVVAKWLDKRFFNGVSEISNTDLITFAILTVITLIFEGVYLLRPSEKSKVIAKIHKHFGDNKPTAVPFDHE